MNIVQEKNRWRWWYSAIADWMVANPGKPLRQACVAHGGPIKVSETYLCMIVNSDLFKEHLAKRKAEFRERLDGRIINGSAELAELSTQIMLETIQSRRDKVPIEVLNEIRTGALETLGYGAKSGPLVNIDQRGADQRVQVAVGPAQLEEARAAIRALEQRTLPPQSARLAAQTKGNGDGEETKTALEEEIRYGEVLEAPTLS